MSGGDRKGRYRHERDVLIAAIGDPRVGECPLALQIIARIIERTDGATGVTYDGLRAIARAVADVYRGEGREYTPKARKAALALARACGYVVAAKLGPPGGGRAVLHMAVDMPSDARRAAAIDAYRAERRSKGTVAVTSDDDAEGNLDGDLSGAEVTLGRTLRSPSDGTPPTPPYQRLS